MNEVEHQDRYGYVRGMVGQTTNRRAYLARLIVSNESQRRQRHGHRLLHLFIEAATTAGDTTMYTQVDPDRSNDFAGVVAFLQHEGFTLDHDMPDGPIY